MTDRPKPGEQPIEIVVSKNGPYEASADLPITPKRAVVSDRDEPLTWARADSLPHDGPALLCRCGQSEDKPFCDGSHLTAEFDGTETASTESFWDRHKTYEGTDLTVHRVGALCEHAGFCANKTTDWHRMLPDTGDMNVRAQVVAMIEHCPSGALVYEVAGEVIEPDLPRAVSPIEDGPLAVTGNVRIVGSDGIPLETRNRVTLCRCGQSANKPMCDGTHAGIGFVAPNPAEHLEEGARTRARPARATLSVFSQIVVGVCAEMTEETYGVAATIARAASSDVSVVHVRTREGQGEQMVSRAMDLAEEAGIAHDRLTSKLEAGTPPSALARAAEDAGAGLMIVGRGGDRLVRVPRRVSHRAPCDVLVVAPRGPDRPDRCRRVLVATDGSATADRAARRGYDLARALGASVDLVFVGHPATGELIVDDTIAVSGEGVATQTWLPNGNPVKRILETAEAVDADLIVVGNKGMTRTRTLLGVSVPGGVLKGARCDVLLGRSVRQLESELEPGDGGVIERNGEPVAAFVDESGELHLMSARCPHLGCLVAWNPTDKTFDCPCHGSRFGALGEIVEGPVTKPLRPI